MAIPRPIINGISNNLEVVFSMVEGFIGAEVVGDDFYTIDFKANYVVKLATLCRSVIKNLMRTFQVFLIRAK